MENARKFRSVYTHKAGYSLAEVITLSCHGYNVDLWEKTIIEKCLADNPTCNNSEVAQLLGISDRNLYRVCKVYGIDLSKKGKLDREAKMIDDLQKHKKIAS